MSRLIPLLMLLIVTQHPEASAACCDSGSTCQALRTSAVDSCVPTGSCATVDALSRATLRLHNSDLRPLTLAQKDLAGTYRLDLPAMKMFNEWVVGDAPGIIRAGKSALSVHRICADGRQIEIAGSVYLMGFSIVFDVLRATRQAGDRTLEGFEAKMDGVSYFFSLP